MKKRMDLRSSSPRLLSRLAAPLVAGLAALALLASTSSAAVSDFGTPLYFDGPASTVLSGSYDLLPTLGPSTSTTLSAGACSSCGAGTLSGQYNYVYVVADATGARTTSNVAAFTASSQWVTLSGLPSGTSVDVYRQKVTTAPANGTNSPYYWVANSGGAAALNDQTSDATAVSNASTYAPLPEAGNRLTTSTFTATCNGTTNCGYLEFSPGIEPTVGTSSNTLPPTLYQCPSTAASPPCAAVAPGANSSKGWIVETPGPVTFQGGTWTFTARTKSTASSINGTAHLVVGLWVVTLSAGSIASSTTIIDPACTGAGTPLASCPASAEGGTNMLPSTTSSTAVSVANVPKFSLAANERLYVQLWRRQTAGYTSGSGSTRLVTMPAYDATTPSKIDHPAADNDAPNAFSLTAPTAGASIRNGQALTSNPSDPSPGSGINKVEYYACSGVSCVFGVGGILLGNSSTSPNYSVTWNSQPIDGTYTIVARATDNVGFTTDSSTVTVTVDNTAPNVSISSAPSSPTNATSASPTFGSTDATATFKCSLDGGAYAACTSPKSYSSLADGSHSFGVEAVDPAGNVSTPASATWTVDTVAPVTTIDSKPSDPSATASPSFAFSANESVTGFKCSLDGAAYAACTSPKSYSGLAQGSHTFAVKAVADMAGNAGSATSYTWTVDTIAPDVSISSSPSSPTNATSATFTFSSTDGTATFKCSLDGGGFAACASPKSYSGLADGSHTFQVESIDPAGNVSTPSSATWTVDTVAPVTSVDSSPSNPTASSSAGFTFSADEAVTGFQCSLDGAGFAACSSPKSYSGLADGSHIFAVKAVADTAGNAGAPTSYSWTVDTTAPDTSISSGPSGLTNATSATFTFGSADATASFRCSLDGAAFAACSSPKGYSGLADGSHTFDVEAVDPAGNVDPTPASASWTVDATAPGTSLTSTPADPATSSSASFSFTSTEPGSTFACSLDGAAFAACTSAQGYSALADGSHSFQVRATDAAGNTDATPAAYSWRIDTTVPAVPALLSPTSSTVARTIGQLSASFSDPDASDTGTVSFRVCYDALCALVATSGSVSAVANGAAAQWTLPHLRDGVYLWEAQAADAAGNASAWSSASTFAVDTMPPSPPRDVAGTVSGGQLTLSWLAPAGDTVGSYVVFVDGAPWRTVDGSTRSVTIGAFDANDRRHFTVAAIDLAGNAGAATQPLVGVPNLLGLTLNEASQAAGDRGLTIKNQNLGFGVGSVVIVGQTPSPASLAPEGSAIEVLLAPVAGAPVPLAARVTPAKISCVAGGTTLHVRVELSKRADVSWRLRGKRGASVASGALGPLPAGATRVTIRLPKAARRPGTYRLVVRARAQGHAVNSTAVVVMSARDTAAAHCG